MTKQTGSGSFDKAERRQERDKATVAELTGFLKAVIVLSIRKRQYFFPDESTLRKGRRERLDKTSGGYEST